VLVPEAACLAAAALHWSLVVVRGLRVNAARMRENLGTLGGLLLSEAVMLRLGETLGRNAAHDLVYDAAMKAAEGGGSFRDLLLADPRVTGVLDAPELDRLLEPTAYTGLAARFVDRVVHAARRLNP
jgi:adenylosuccinate lyase